MNEVELAEIGRLRNGLLRDAEIVKLCSGAVRRFTRMLMLMRVSEKQVVEIVKAVYRGDAPR